MADVQARLRCMETDLRTATIQARELLLAPCEGWTAEACYMQAFHILYERATAIEVRLDALASEVGNADPADTLKATLAAIVDEGHAVIELSRETDGHWAAHTQTAIGSEFGTVGNLDPEDAARERLEWIREMPRQKVAADGIAADVPPQVIHRAMDQLAAAQARRTDAASEEGS